MSYKVGTLLSRVPPGHGCTHRAHLHTALQRQEVETGGRINDEPTTEAVSLAWILFTCSLRSPQSMLSCSHSGHLKVDRLGATLN